ncbi:peptidoglycan editing factor PgeF [Thiogranum longum]|uniref:peptidoglycan editing factor PgeF n=1 Tax=Thiogranum longum TaxID=1537524 RepID=UPI00311E1745
MQALTTTRKGGVSRGPWASLNLADHVGDDPLAVQENRRHLHQSQQLPAEPLWLKQVQGDDVAEVALYASQPGRDSRAVPQIEPPRADASIVRGSGQVSAVLTADCLPVLFCERSGRCAAAAHAGWRGLAAGVLERTVQVMGIDPAELLVWLGPAIGPQAFEVGDEVRSVFVARHTQSADAFTLYSPGHWLADLYHLARIRLAGVGVSAVYGGDRCTFTEDRDFYSYRRDGVTGRMATLIWLSS